MSTQTKIKRNKAIRPGDIVREMLTALDNLGIDKFTKIINGI